MFGFIKLLQQFIDKLKNNKRMWFTTLFVISVTGIVLSIVLLILLTGNAAKDVYKAQSNEYKLRYNNFTINKLSEFRRLSTIVLQNSALIEVIEQDDIEASTQMIANFNNSLEEEGFNDYEITYYSAQNSVLTNIIASVIQTRNTMYGLHSFSDGMYYIYIEPIIIDNQTIGVLQLKSSAKNMYLNFLNLDQEFAFLLDKNTMTNISLNVREENYNELAELYIYNSQMFNNDLIRELDTLNPKEFREFLDNGYVVTDNYYIAYDRIVDIKGMNAGLVVFGERKDKNGGFINVTTKITDQVIMVALGLIVSVLLFMF